MPARSGTASARSRRCAPSPSRSRTWSGRCPTGRCIRPRRRSTARSPSRRRCSSTASAYAPPSSRIMMNVAALYQSTVERPVHEEWVNGLADELLQDDAGAYVGFLADEGEARVRAAYPGPTWDRLRQVKRRYDPDNVFRLNQNIPPAEE